MKTKAITKGDLAVVRSTEGAGIVMVTRVYPRIFNGVLIHTAPEMATDADIVIPQGEVTPYPLVLQFDLYGVFYRSQVVKIVGHVPVEGIVVTGLHPYAIPVEVGAHLEHMGAWRGLPLWRSSPRWRFKEEQLTEELQPLVRPFWSRFQW